MRGDGALGFAGSPSQPRLVRFNPQATRQRSSCASESSTRARPRRSLPSAVTTIDSIASIRTERKSTSTSASEAHGGFSSIASWILPCTRSIGRALRADRASITGQPEHVSRSRRTISTSARPSAPLASRLTESSSASNRTRHSSARSTSEGRSSSSARSSTACSPPILPIRVARSSLRRSLGSAAGFVGGGGVARRIDAMASAGSGFAADMPATSASRTRSAHARSRSTSLASTDAAIRVPPDTVRPIRNASHTEAPRSPTDADSAARSTS